jgi:hypothetical protein
MERDDFQHAVIQMLQHYWAGKEPKETTSFCICLGFPLGWHIWSEDCTIFE